MISIKAILFDLDGTLTDPGEGIINSIGYALETMGHPCPAPEALAVHIGPPLQLAFAAIFGPGNDEMVKTAIGHYRQRYSIEGRGMVENRLYPGITETLAALKDVGKHLYVATSKPTPITRQITAHFSLDDYFDGIYGSELDGTRSNKGDLIAYLLKQENINPGEAVMIGDRKHDILGASQNGMRSVGVCWGYGSEEELRNAGAIRLAHSPQDLVGIILQT